MKEQLQIDAGQYVHQFIIVAIVHNAKASPIYKKEHRKDLGTLFLGNSKGKCLLCLLSSAGECHSSAMLMVLILKRYLRMQLPLSLLSSAGDVQSAKSRASTGKDAARES